MRLLKERTKGDDELGILETASSRWRTWWAGDCCCKRSRRVRERWCLGFREGCWSSSIVRLGPKKGMSVLSADILLLLCSLAVLGQDTRISHLYNSCRGQELYALPHVPKLITFFNK